MSTHPVSTKQLVILLFIIIQLEVLLLAFRVEHNDSRINSAASRAVTLAQRGQAHSREDAREFYTTCQRLNSNREILNRGYQRLADLEARNTQESEQLVAARVATYKAMVVPLLVCGTRP